MYLKKTTFIILCFFCLQVFPQGKKIDSLLRLARTERNDTVRTKHYIKVAGAYLNMGIADSCFLYSRKVLFLSQEQHFIKGLAVACNFLGQAQSYTGNLDSAIYYFKEAKKYFNQQGDAKREAGMLNNLGIIYKDQGNMSKSLDLYFQALRLKEQLKDTEGVADVYTNIGHLYNDMNDTASMLKYELKALDLRRKINDRSGIGNSLMSVGLYYQTVNQLDKALVYLEEALKIGEELNEEESIAIGCFNLANVYYKQHKLAEAEALYMRSLELSRKNKNPKGIAVSLERLGRLNLDKHDTKAAIIQLEESYRLNTEIDLKDAIATAGILLAEAYEQSGNYKKAYAFYKASDAIQDSLFNAENVRKLTSEGLKYEYEKERLLLQKEQEHKEALARASSFKKNLVILASLIFLAVVMVFSYTLLKKLKENRRQKEIIEEQRNEMIASINYASRIQDALLANTDVLQQHLPEHFILFKPKDIVSGDFYWAAEKNGYFYLAVCDCTGHGVPGAFMSLLNINFLNEAISEKNITEPHEILNYVRNQLIEKMEGKRDGMDAIILRLPVQRSQVMEVEYAAANNSPILVSDQQMEKLNKDKMPVGLGEINTSFTTHRLEVKSGDTLYLYTDGYGDQFGGPKGKKFKHTQLDALLHANAQKPLVTQKDILLVEFDTWKRNLDQVDDVCIVGLRL